MSHGPHADGVSAEPNLVPLLDVVFQLLMFFMMCVNFVNEQITEEVALPESQSALPMDKSEVEALVLNIAPFSEDELAKRYNADVMARLTDKFKEGDPYVSVVGQEPMKLAESKFYLRDEFDRAERNSKDGKVNAVIILRAHRKIEYEHVYRLFEHSRTAGFKKFEVRALTKSGGAA